MTKYRSTNYGATISATSSITGKNEYLLSTNNILNVAGSFSLSGTLLPISGATTGIGVAILDSSGNQISSFGGGTQYIQGTTTSPSTGTVVLGRYEASPTGTSTDGGLYPPLMDNFHQLKVVPVGTQQINNIQIAGTTIDTNSGNKSAGTQRIVLATDQPNLTTPFNVNVSQMAGVTPSSNTGATDAGTQRIVLPNDYLSTATIQAGPDSTATGGIVANGGTVTAAVVNGMQGFGFAYYGTYATGATLTWEASADGGTTYTAFTLQAVIGLTGPVTVIAAVSNSQSFFEGVLPTGATHVRIRCSAWAAPTGTINIRMVQSSQPRVQTTNVISSVSGVGSVTAGSITPVPLATQTGLLTFFAVAQVATVTAVKVSAGRLYNYNVTNPNASDIYLQFFDLATGSVTLGTTTPKASYRIPASGTWDGFWVYSLGYNVAISVACTTTATGLTAPGIGALVNLGYI